MIDMPIHHLSIKTLFVWIYGYLLFVYFPIRLLSFIFLSKKFGKHMSYPLDSPSYGSVFVASLFTVIQYFGVSNIPGVRMKTKLPNWLEMVAFFVASNDIVCLLALFTVGYIFP